MDELPRWSTLGGTLALAPKSKELARESNRGRGHSSYVHGVPPAPAAYGVIRSDGGSRRDFWEATFPAGTAAGRDGV